jgi:subtilase family protein
MKLLRFLLFLTAAVSLQATDHGTMGVALLRQIDPTLQGSGVRVAQPEGTFMATDFEINPAMVGQPVSLFTYINSVGATATTFPNAVGIESGHADLVAINFISVTNGVAPQINHMDNYEAGYFVNHFIGGNLVIPARVVNQSFGDTSQQAALDSAYDDYAAARQTIFVSAVGNGGPVLSPASCYNGIGVGIYGPPSAAGPTYDGRCKPDLTAPEITILPSANSYSTPYVAGAAAVLVQAADRGDGGVNTTDAHDTRTIKALLINGAVKPTGWTNSPTFPLDARYGAGLVNVFNSWTQLKGGLHEPIESTSVTSSSPHPPGGNTNNLPVLVGWDSSIISNSGSDDKINHYYFKLPGTNTFTLTATLAWNRQQNETTINDLNLFLYRTSDTNLIASSVSVSNNVEHLFLPQLAPGRYDLQVLKKRNSAVANNETYALAFEMFNLPLTITRSNSSVVITWPLAPTGFSLQSTTSLNPPVSWTTVPDPVSVDTINNRNVVTLSATTGNQFFRLLRPTAGFGL